MTINELHAILKSKNLNECMYSLDGLHNQSESLSLVSDGEKYKVCYKERGEAIDLASSLSEEEACEFIFNEFKKSFNW